MKHHSTRPRSVSAVQRRVLPQTPGGARRARQGVLEPGRVERRAPASVVVLRKLQIEALAVHPDGDVAEAGPGIEPGSESPQRAVVRRSRKPSEAECCSQKLAALVEHRYSMT